MQTLYIILMLFSIAAYIAAIGFVAYAVSRLHHAGRTLEDIQEKVEAMTILSMTRLVREQSEQLNDLQQAYQQLIDSEDYKEAGEMAKIIKHQEETLQSNIDNLKKIFGKEVAGVFKVKHDFHSDDPDD